MKTSPIDFILSTLVISILCLISFLSIKFGVRPFSTSLLAEYHIIVDTLLFLFFYGLASALLLRLMMLVKPFTPGSYSMDDSLFIYWKLFTVTYEFGKGALLPFTTVFAKPVIALLFGAKIGKDIALGGTLVDPQLIEIGDEAIVGQDTVITAHTITSGMITLTPVRIAAKATIGVNSVLMSGVEVGENSVVAAGSVVPPNTHIPANELWGGIPAKKIKAL